MLARELHGEPQRPVARAEREPRTECVGDLEALRKRSPRPSSHKNPIETPRQHR